MAMYQKVKDKAVAISNELDAKADEQVDKAKEQANKVKESRFTWAILGGAALAMAVILVLLAAY